MIDFETFKEAAKRQLPSVMEDPSPAAIAMIDRKGRDFKLEDDGGVDSLDVLDLIFAISKDLKVNLPPTMGPRTTLGELYDDFRNLQ